MAHDSDFVDIDARDEPSFANVGMEFELLSAACRRSESEPGAITGLHPAWFTDPFFAEIARGMVALAQRGERVEPEALFAAIGKKARDKLAGCFIGGKQIATLGEFARLVSTHRVGASFEHYAVEVSDYWFRRNAKIAAGYMNGGSASEGVVEFLAKVEELKGLRAAFTQVRVNESDAETLKGMVAPEYLIDGLLQRRMVYALTGVNGHGKTTVAVRLAVALAQGWSIGPHHCRASRVLYMAGENEDDFFNRLVGIVEHEGLDDSGVKTIIQAGPLADFIPVVQAYAKRTGPLDCIFIDTKRAYRLAGTEENDNDDAIATAQACRAMSQLVEGRPTVVVVSHPKLRPQSAADLIPAGGGAFLTQIDGNITVEKSADEIVTVARHCDKFRGAPWEPLKFELHRVARSSRLNGMPSVCAVLMTAAQVSGVEDRHSDDQVAILVYLERAGAQRQKVIATALGWVTELGAPEEMRVSRAIKDLKAERYVVSKPNGVEITDKGRKLLKEIAAQRDKLDAMRARYGPDA